MAGLTQVVCAVLVQLCGKSDAFIVRCRIMVCHVLQGEVVTLANKALQSLCSRGTNVLLEGRSQTVNYIRQVARSFR